MALDQPRVVRALAGGSIRPDEDLGSLRLDVAARLAAPSACAALETGSLNVQRVILRAWIARIEADGTQPTVTVTLPPDVGGSGSGAGSSTNEGQNPGLTDVLPRVGKDGGGGSRTRVRNHSATASTCVASEYDPALQKRRGVRFDHDLICVFIVLYGPRDGRRSGLSRS